LAEGLFSGLAANSVLIETLDHWQGLAFVPVAFLSGIWLLFSLILCVVVLTGTRSFVRRGRDVRFNCPIA
jgi:hypothetical protein